MRTILEIHKHSSIWQTSTHFWATEIPKWESRPLARSISKVSRSIYSFLIFTLDLAQKQSEPYFESELETTDVFNDEDVFDPRSIGLSSPTTTTFVIPLLFQPIFCSTSPQRLPSSRMGSTLMCPCLTRVYLFVPTDLWPRSILVVVISVSPLNTSFGRSTSSVWSVLAESRTSLLLFPIPGDSILS